MYIIGIFLVTLGLYLIFLSESHIIIRGKIKASRNLRGTINIPFKEKLRRFALKGRTKAFNREIYSSLITLNNLAIVTNTRPLSLDKILEYLAYGAVKLKPVYLKTLSLLRSKGPDEAFKYFEKMIPTKRGMNYSSLLKKLDKINPVELTEQIRMMKETISLENLTENAKDAVANGNITMAVSTVPVLLLIINFAYVVVLQDVFKMLSNIF